MKEKQRVKKLPPAVRERINAINKLMEQVQEQKQQKMQNAEKENEQKPDEKG